MSTTREPPSNGQSPYAEPARIRQLHTVCLLLDAERRSQTAAVAERPKGGLHPTAAHLFIKLLVSVVFVAAGAVALGAYLAKRPEVIKVTDYRLASHYESADLGDLLFDEQRQIARLGTQGDGLHSLDVRSGFWSHDTHESTSGGLLTNDLVNIEQDAAGRCYFLCRRGETSGLCSASTGLNDWRTIFDLSRFPALQSDPRGEQVSAVAMVDGRLWIGTREAGIGVYNPQTHGWEALHRASLGGLLDDHVRDLAADSAGALWIATDNGINRVRGESWQRFVAGKELVGPKVTRLFLGPNQLWYTTAAGGLGRFDGQTWQVLAPETGWATHGQDDVTALCHDPQADRFWLAAKDQSLGCYDCATRTWATYVKPPGDRIVESIAAGVNPAGPRLWVGTSDGILNLDIDGKWSPLQLAGHRVTAIDSSSVSLVALAGSQAADSAFISRGDGHWQQAIGPGRAPSGSRNILAAAYDERQKLLWAGGEKGLAAYDPAVHDWTRRITAADGMLPSDEVIDLDVRGEQLLTLTSPGSVSLWNTATDTWQGLLGGGRLPGGLGDVTAVTRDTAGRLWLGTRANGLHVYDPRRCEWMPIVADLADVTALAAASNGVWVMAGGNILFTPGAAPPQPIEPPLEAPQLKLFAAPDTVGAIVIDDAGRVVLLSGPTATERRTIVGKPAKELDLDVVTGVAVLGDLVLLGGPNPHLYNAATRSWQTIGIGPVAQVMPAHNELWLRSEENKLFHLSASDTSPQASELGLPIVHLSAAQSQLVALGGDGSVWSFAPAAGWKMVKTAVGGPTAGALTEGEPLVLAHAEDLHIATGKDRRWWRFMWAQQRWQAVADANDRPVQGVEQLCHGDGRVFAQIVEAGLVYSLTPDQAKATREPLTAIRRLRSTGSAVLATDVQGTSHLFAAGRWVQPLGVATASLPAGSNLRDVAQLTDGLLVGGSKGAAVLTPSLATWQPVIGAVDVTRLLQAGDSLWALSAANRLHWLDRSAGAARWQPIEQPAAVAGATASLPAATQEELWACLVDGSVHRVTGAATVAWHQPSVSPYPPKEIIGVAPAADGVVIGFRRGLAYFVRHKRIWKTMAGPPVQRIERFIALGDGQAADSYWVLGSNGELHALLRDSAATWQLMASTVSDISTHGKGLLAVSTQDRTLTKFDAAGKMTTLFTGRAPPVRMGSIAAAGEVAMGDGRTALVLATDTGLHAYDPINRQWTAANAHCVSLHGTIAGLVGRTTNGQALRVLVNDHGIETAAITTEAPVAQIASSGADDRLLMRLADGRLQLSHGGTVARQLVGRQLPAETATARIVDFAALDPRLFLALSDGSFHAYESETREWHTMPQIRFAARMAAGHDVLWVETRTPPGKQLVLVQAEAGRLTSRVVLNQLAGWHLTPHGVVADIEHPVGAKRVLVAPTGEVRTIMAAPSLGPEEATVTGGMVAQGALWLRSDTGQLWHYHPGTHVWSPVDLGTSNKLQAAFLELPRPLVLTDQGTVLEGTPVDEQATSWRFTEIERQVRRMDVAGDRAVLLTDDALVVRKLSAAGPVADPASRVVQTIRSRAWQAEQSDPVAAVGSGDELWVANKVKEIGSYDLRRRRWTQHPSAPFEVERLFLVGGRLHASATDKKLAVLDGNSWQTIEPDDQNRWQAPGVGLVMLAADGRLWLTNQEAPPKLVPAASSVWVVSKSGLQVAISVQWLPREKTPVQLNGAGQLTVDLPRSVAISERSVYVATAAGVLAHSTDLATLKAVHRVDAAEVSMDSTGGRLLAQPSDGSVWAFDGTLWKPSIERVDGFLAQRGLRGRAAGAPLEFALDLGSNVRGFPVKYVGRALSHDVPVSSAGEAVTYDGRHVIVSTRAGLLWRDHAGRVEWIFKAADLGGPPQGLAWSPTGTANPALYVRGEGTAVWRHGDRGPQAVTADWAALAAERRVVWRGADHLLEPSISRTEATLRKPDSSAPALTVDLRMRGVTSDAVRDVALTGNWAWLLSGDGLQRVDVEEPQRRQFLALPVPTAARQLRVLAGRMLLTEGDAVFELPAEGQLRALNAGGIERAELAAALVGHDWRVSGRGAVPRIEFHGPAGSWTDLGFDAAAGMGCDQPRRVCGLAGAIVVDTAAGLCLVPDANGPSQFALNRITALPHPGYVGSSGVVAPVQEFYCHGDTLWCRPSGSTSWRQLDPQAKSWQQSDKPHNYDVLFHGDNATWQRTAAGAQLSEATEGGRQAISTFTSDRGLDSDQIRAVLRTGDGLWLASAAGLRLIDPQSHALLSVESGTEFRADRYEFARDGADYFLQCSTGSQHRAFRLETSGWRSIKLEDSPFSPQRRIVEGPLLRVVRKPSALHFELRVAPDVDRWVSCNFMSGQGRFDFQIARDAAALEDQLHTVTALGTVTWRREKGEHKYYSLQPEMQSLETWADPPRIVCFDAAKTGHEWHSPHRWEGVPESDLDRSRVTQSSRWQCLRGSNGLTLRVQPAKDQWQDLALDPQGDFSYRRTARLVAAAGDVWTATANMIVRYAPTDAEKWLPQAFWTIDRLGSKESKTVRELFSLEGHVYAELDDRLVVFEPDAGWQPVQEAAAIRRERNRLWSADGWHWQRDTEGVVSASRVFASDPHNDKNRVELQWDAATGRFHVDTVQEAAVWRDAVWLATRQGLQHITAADGRTTRYLGAQQPVAQSLFYDRQQRQVFAQAHDRPDAHYLDYDEQHLPREGAAVATGRAHAVADSAYCDQEWRFTLGAVPQLSWQEFPSDLVDGRFVHDQFQSLSRFGEDIWLPTPVALRHARLGTDGLSFVKDYPLPAQARAVEIVDGAQESLVGISDAGRASRLDVTGDGAWTFIDDDAPRERTLVDTPLWTWRRTRPGLLTVTVKPTDLPQLSPIVSDAGRFVFDEAGVCLADGEAVWHAGSEGIVRRNTTDGAMTRWYRLGHDGAGQQPLGSVVALGRFTGEGYPLASSADAEQLAEAALYALGANGQAWKLDPAGAGQWRREAANPWQTPDGRLIARHKLFDVSSAPNGLTFRHRPATAADGPVLANGRLSIDVVASLALTDGRAYLATLAGLMEINPETGLAHRLWTAGGDRDEDRLGECHSLFVHHGDGRLYAHASSNHLFRLDPAAASWRSASHDEAFEAASSVLHDDDFWTWYRWSDGVHVRLNQAGLAPPAWPLFVAGRFSFDALQNIHISGNRLWAATSGGILAYRLDDLRIEGLDRMAQDPQVGPVPMLEVNAFSVGEPLVALDGKFRYQYERGRWVRQITTGNLPTPAYTDGDRHWVMETGANGGWLVRLVERPGAPPQVFHVLGDLPPGRMRSIVAGDNRLWIGLDRGLYRIQPR